MKKTLSVNIGGSPFILDEDAYEVLREYLSQIETRLDASENREVMEDVEGRIADLFRENLSARVQVVSIETVRRVMAILGPPAEFGELRRAAAREAQQPPRRFTRSSSDRVIGGVCGGLAAYWKIDPLVLRILTTVAVIPLGGAPVLVYGALWALMPSDDGPAIINLNRKE